MAEIVDSSRRIRERKRASCALSVDGHLIIEEAAAKKRRIIERMKSVALAAVSTGGSYRVEIFAVIIYLSFPSECKYSLKSVPGHSLKNGSPLREEYWFSKLINHNIRRNLNRESFNSFENLRKIS